MCKAHLGVNPTGFNETHFYRDMQKTRLQNHIKRIQSLSFLLFLLLLIYTSAQYGVGTLYKAICKTTPFYKNPLKGFYGSIILKSCLL